LIVAVYYDGARNEYCQSWFCLEISRMRVSKEEGAANHARIVSEAARLFRERGLGVGVDALTQAAGLTHGSLYSRFGSKEALAAEAVAHAFACTAEKWDGVESLAKYADAYLSVHHRDNPGHGCTISALGSEMPRQGKTVRRHFTEGIRRSMARLARLTSSNRERQRQDEALAYMATLLGTLVLARAVDDPKFSDQILKAGRAHLAKAF
jgi:TetR/AcrR family transcriptional regulator, transcriptional repressor for nem operon